MRQVSTIQKNKMDSGNSEKLELNTKADLARNDCTLMLMNE